VSRQCELLELGRSSYYYEPATESAENLLLMEKIDQEYTAHPFLGSRGLTAWLQGQGLVVNRKRVQRLMRLMRLEAVYPKPRLSVRGVGHKVYPYLLRNVTIERVNQVWSMEPPKNTEPFLSMKTAPLEPAGTVCRAQRAGRRRSARSSKRGVRCGQG